MQPRHSSLIRRTSRPLAYLGLWLLAANAAADHPPEVVAQFTRSVQPLLLNKCAMGACHGGPTSAAPRLQRPASRNAVDRRTTLANLDAFLAATGPDRDPQPLVTMLAGRHPANAATSSLRATPLAAESRATLESWLTLVRDVERSVHVDPAVTLASGTDEGSAAPRPNRLKALLDAASNPQELPPPQEPQGLIFGKDRPPDE